MLRPIARIYAPLGDHLAACGAAGERRVTLTFAAIEALFGAAPARDSARVTPASAVVG